MLLTGVRLSPRSVSHSQRPVSPSFAPIAVFDGSHANAADIFGYGSSKLFTDGARISLFCCVTHQCVAEFSNPIFKPPIHSKANCTVSNFAEPSGQTRKVTEKRLALWLQAPLWFASEALP
jgi:hypothetical protein